MKPLEYFKIPFVVLSMLAFGQTTTAQSASDVFKYDANIIWTGVDFTKVKVIGETGTVSPVELLMYFDKINGVITAEPKKYNFAEALSKKTVEFDLSAIMKVNSKINPDEALSMNSSATPEIPEEYIAQSILNYELETKEGIGLVIFMKSLHKPKETGFMTLTFYDIKTRKVLFSENMSGKAQGFGFRNHYAYTVYDVIKQVKLGKYSSWKTKYGN